MNGERQALKDEVEAIFMLIRRTRDDDGKSYDNLDEVKQSKELDRQQYKVIGVSLVILVFVFCLSYFLGETGRVITQILILVGYFVIGVTTISSFNSIKHDFKDLGGFNLNLLNIVVSSEVSLFNELDQFSEQSIKYVSARLKHFSGQSNFIASCFIGAFEKIGVIPGIIATIVALREIQTLPQFGIIEGFSLGLVIFYFFMISTAVSTRKLERFSLAFDYYLKDIRVGR